MLAAVLLTILAFAVMVFFCALFTGLAEDVRYQAWLEEHER